MRHAPTSSILTFEVGTPCQINGKEMHPHNASLFPNLITILLRLF